MGVRWEGAAGGACHVIWRVCWERKEGRAVRELGAEPLQQKEA